MKPEPDEAVTAALVAAATLSVIPAPRGGIEILADAPRAIQHAMISHLRETARNLSAALRSEAVLTEALLAHLQMDEAAGGARLALNRAGQLADGAAEALRSAMRPARAIAASYGEDTPDPGSKGVRQARASADRTAVLADALTAAGHRDIAGADTLALLAGHREITGSVLLAAGFFAGACETTSFLVSDTSEVFHTALRTKAGETERASISRVTGALAEAAGKLTRAQQDIQCAQDTLRRAAAAVAKRTAGAAG